ncbi:hypothetical protein GQ54DRAFT_298895 [Martensiomyces pterosporus]|nr:hypothetical protein GQ54DRAFT_298895 [Martensiomyces pterosporus]
MEVSHLCTEQLLDSHAVEPWKLNMTAVSSQSALLLVGAGKDVLAYSINHYLQPPTLKARLKYPNRLQSDEINAIALGALFGEEVVAAVYDSGRVIVWKVGSSFELLWEYQNTASTWGCAIHSSTNTVAISANSHSITVLRPKQVDACAREEGAGDEGSELDAGRPRLFTGETMLISQHESNIPCVAFSACGGYLASASIDGTFRVWSLRTGQEACRLDYSEWGWSALFVYPYYFMPAPLAGKVISQPGQSMGNEQASASLQPRQGHADLMRRLAGELASYIDVAYHGSDDEEAGASEGEWDIVDDGRRDRSADTGGEENEYANEAEHLLDEESEGDDAGFRLVHAIDRDADGTAASTVSDDMVIIGQTQPQADQDASEPALLPDDREPPLSRQFDHSGDMQNGHAVSENATESQQSNQESRSGSPGTLDGIVSEAADPRAATPLLLCCSAEDALLLDPSTHSMPVVDRIQRVTSSSEALLPLRHTRFERLSFLDWVPELGIGVIGGYSGKVAVVSLQQEASQQQQPSYRIKILANLSADKENSPLYGMSIYRHSVHASGSCAVILYLTFLSGKFVAYELSSSLDVASSA